MRGGVGGVRRAVGLVGDVVGGGEAWGMLERERILGVAAGT